MDAGAGLLSSRMKKPTQTTTAQKKAASGRPEQAHTGHDVLCMMALKTIDYDNDGYILKPDLIDKLAQYGLDASDPRLQDIYDELDTYDNTQPIELRDFVPKVQHNSVLLTRALRGELVLPEFSQVTEEITAMFQKLRRNKDGKVADYIPQLAKINPEKTALAVCTVDGQTFAIGDYDDQFCLQSTCKPLLYTMALEGNGEDKVHQHTGREPSGASFNALTLNDRGLPHNPMINAGAIMSCSLIKADSSTADRFDYFSSRVQAMAGEKNKIGFDNAVCQSEKETGHRNYALGHFMKEKGAFPGSTDVEKTLEFYFQCCSVTSNTAGLAAIGATLANGGVQPHTGQKVMHTTSVKHCLSLMLTCGMYDYSGEWAFLVGIPAKSGVSGALIAVIPGVMGVCLWSPRLNEQGNTARGVEFFKHITERYPFHLYDGVIGANDKKDPRVCGVESEIKDTLALLSAASTGDMAETLHLAARGVDLNSADYDGRTAAHLAASEGQIKVLEYLIAMGAKLDPVDRWNGTPLDDAKRENRGAVVKLLRAQQKK